MVLARLAQTQSFSDLLLLLFGGVAAFLLSYVLMFGIIALSRRLNLIRPAEPGRKQDPRARLGGVGIYLAFVIASLIFYINNPALYVSYNRYHDEATMYWLFLVASALIVLVNAYDDIKPLKPLPKLLAQTVAVIMIIGPFVDGLFHGVLLFGFSNPFQATGGASAALPWYQQASIIIFIHRPEISLLAIPAVLITWFWMAGMMNTVNWIDGSDGLAGGIVAITGVFFVIISWRLGQDTIAILAAIFTGSVLGFLPHNWNPAKILMGDSGAHFLGLGLAALSIIGGAKVALVLMVMGFPIVNIAVVIINRVRHGRRPWHYDSTHLHDRLRATGFNAKQICYVFYSLTAIFGILALNLFHFYKLIGIVLVVVAMAALIAWIDYRQRSTQMGLEDGSSGLGEQTEKSITSPIATENNQSTDSHSSLGPSNSVLHQS